MTRIAYYYQGNKNQLEQLLEYQPTILISDEDYVDELLKYNLPIKNIIYDNACYDIVTAETNNLDTILATKKVVIGNYKDRKPKTMYMSTLDMKLITEKRKKKDTHFCIVVPNFNNADWINRTIESVLNQTYQDWNMYVIDDMSTDNSVEVIKSYKDKRITLIQNEIKLYNGGSRNLGILKAKKEYPEAYLLFIDSDDWLANNEVLEGLNDFIEDEDLITLDYQYYMDNEIKPAKSSYYKNKDELFMTVGCMCAVWCKCFKVSVAPLFEFNTLMEDRNYHYRLINRIETYAHFSKVTHTWNKMNTKSVTSNKDQHYDSQLQAKIEWDNCAYRHIAGMLDILNELDNQKWKDFIKEKINICKNNVTHGEYLQY